MDGELVCSCLVLGVERQGLTLETIEGVADRDQLHVIQEKFLEHAALQCGICTPGLIVSTKSTVSRKPNPTEEGSALLLSGESLPVHRLRQNY